VDESNHNDNVLDDRYTLISDSQDEIQQLKTITGKAEAVDSVVKVSNTHRAELVQFMYNVNEELTESVSLKGLLGGKPNLGVVYTKEESDVRERNAKLETDDKLDAKQGTPTDSSFATLLDCTG
jgi:hypothetical protein